MAWNEPGGGNDKDPWGNRGDQGPPDLDEAIRKLQTQLSGIFGGKSGGSGGSRSGGISSGAMGLALAALVAVYVFTLTVSDGKHPVRGLRHQVHIVFHHNNGDT